MAASTKEVVEHHLKALGEADIEGILEDYTDDSVLFSPDGILRGPDELRPLFEGFFAEFAKPGSSIDIKDPIIDGEAAFFVWSGQSADNVYEFAADTFVVRDGKIVIQSFAAKVVPRS